MRALYEALNSRKLIAHNFVFDGAVLQRMASNLGLPHSWPFIACTYGMACQLENKTCLGGLGRLKNLQVSQLGWEDKGDVELDEWLVVNGYTTKPVIAKEGKPIDWAKYKADKSKMSNAPSNILGKYGGLDSQSTWALYCIYRKVMKKFPELWKYHQREYGTLGKLVAEQQWGGFNVDKTHLKKYYLELMEHLMKLEVEFRASEAAPFIDEYNRLALVEHDAKEIHPFTASGEVSKNWMKWSEKRELIEVSEEHFKIVGNGSDAALKWLFYQRLFELTPTRTKKDWKGKYEETDVLSDTGEKIATLRLKKGGALPFDKEIVPKLGYAGKLLAVHTKISKEASYIKGMLDSLIGNIHYPQLKLSGTVTGRCAGTGGVNIQQQPKAPRYMECIRPPKGEAWLQMDVDALEPVVLAELSEDESMMQLYGPGRPPNDVYLFVASKIEQFAKEICQYYDPLNPTKEGIKAAKKHCKKLRGICKVLHLSAGYGAGAMKIWMTLTGQGVVITLDEVKAIRTMYWEVFKDVVGYKDGLTSEWKRRGGWFYNGRYRPLTVHQHFEKDILNRCIQSTGHDNLMLYLYHLDAIRTERSIPMRPIMVDFHDETIWAVPVEHKQTALKAMQDAWTRTNKDLGGIIPLTGEPEEVKSWATFKCEDWEDFSWIA